MKRLISNQICPEINFKDALYLWAQLPGIKSKKQLNFSDFFGTDQYLLTNTARTALGILIDRLKLSKKKKIGIPAFCCCVMATPFLHRGYKIEWIDTNDKGLMDIKDFKTKSDDIGLLILPHIFGQKAPLAQAYKIAKEKGIFLLEDCAHRLPDEKWESDARLYSFGREKIISCVSGGALVLNPNTEFNTLLVRKFKSSLLPLASRSWTIKHMLQPLIYTISMPWYFRGGKIIPWLFQKLKWLPLAVTPREKKGDEDTPQESLSFPHQKLLRRQINNLNKKINHKEALSKLWKSVLHEKIDINEKDIIIPDNFFRTIIRLNQGFKPSFLKKAQQRGFYLREWDGMPISPKGVDLKAFGYRKGQCPKAEKFANRYVTLPTNQRVKATDVVSFGKIWSH